MEVADAKSPDAATPKVIACRPAATNTRHKCQRVWECKDTLVAISLLQANAEATGAESLIDQVPVDPSIPAILEVMACRDCSVGCLERVMPLILAISIWISVTCMPN